ncbi:hypothetical protein NUW54_g3644 [Trametes sanguinea]|uniref:Uncharacterized protein n=1 Tax=Trametes sanguinea TaxID=158606 RepID=A0ACC1Q2P6_9APHY|nr:hypothetical protein NUW54_g3644 [Trametes sanguinea]
MLWSNIKGSRIRPCVSAVQSSAFAAHPFSESRIVRVLDGEPATDQVLAATAIMQFSTFVKLALCATQLGMVTAIPSALEERSLNGIFDNCTTDSDCGAGEYCYDGVILTLFDIPSVRYVHLSPYLYASDPWYAVSQLCIPTDWDVCGSGSSDGATD